MLWEVCNMSARTQARFGQKGGKIWFLMYKASKEMPWNELCEMLISRNDMGGWLSAARPAGGREGTVSCPHVQVSLFTRFFGFDQHGGWMVPTGFGCLGDPQSLYKLIKLLTIKWFPVVLGAAAGVGCFLRGWRYSHPACLSCGPSEWAPVSGLQLICSTSTFIHEPEDSLLH